MPEWWLYFEAGEELRCHPADAADLPATKGYRCWVEWSMIRRAALADAKEELNKKAAARRPPSAPRRSGRRR